MAFDAGMVHAVAHELETKLSGGRVERVNQPEKDEIVLLVHSARKNYKLSICAGANNPRIALTAKNKENPATPPQFCTALRKYLTGARILSVKQMGFERVIEICFDSRDEMGFYKPMTLYCEIMGKYSNIIFCDENKRIVSVIRPVDFTTSQKRQVLPGMEYELPPPQDKLDPTSVTKEKFLELASQRDSEYPTDKFIMNTFLGISALVAREIAVRSTLTLTENAENVYGAFEYIMRLLCTNKYVPTMVLDENKRPIEYCFIDVKQYEGKYETKEYSDISELLDTFFDSRDSYDHTRQRAADLFKLLENHKNRLIRKIAAQTEELELCAKKDEFKNVGDLITAYIWMLKKGMKKASLADYNDPEMKEICVELDPRLTPSQNAQQYYKKYNKAKNAEIALKIQLDIAKKDLYFIESEIDLLSRTTAQSELDEIRRELIESGYAGKSFKKVMSKNSKIKPHEYVTANGFKLLVGKNNLQNDMLTFKTAEKNDWWFHVKGAPGSHVIMICDGVEPPEIDFTQAATVAAIYSSRSDNAKIDVDYTKVRHLHKPTGAKPGFVTYTTYWSAVVTPDRSVLEKLSSK